ncbi:VOC family protein [Agrococcus versicolor]|uniref:VOC family protein n=2 Tax=Agrococcus versicolor TaxID=501482 RepID=A0ABP5MH46_9MICO
MNDFLPDATRMGPVTLRTADLARLERWYLQGPGLSPIAESPGAVELGVDGRTLVRLEAAPDLRGPDPRAAGLFHTAVLYEDQASLAAAVLRMTQVPGMVFAGVGDHGVSEAFYFVDPDGNGVELYADRPRDVWRWQDGRVQMTTDGFDPSAFVREHLVEGAGQPTGATVGHVHLQVGDVPTARAFYVDALGFAETASLGGQALFVSAGGYHHHMAMNTWNSAGAGRRADTLGLGLVDVVVPDAESMGAVRERLADRGVQVADDGATLGFDDPWGNRIRLGA